MRTRLKVCCIQSPDEAALAVEMGADALGLVSAMPSGPGPISFAAMEEIADTVPPGISIVLLTASTDPGWLVAQAELARANTVQIVGDPLTEDAFAQIRKSLPSAKVLQVVHVEGSDAIDRAQKVTSNADALLLDSGRPLAATPELGGTGRAHDWAISAKIVRQVSKPVWLAGGLNPENITRAIAQVRPFGVDVCTGLRQDGALDRGLLQRFVEAIRIADETVGLS